MAQAQPRQHAADERGRSANDRADYAEQQNEAGGYGPAHQQRPACGPDRRKSLLLIGVAPQVQSQIGGKHGKSAQGFTADAMPAARANNAEALIRPPSHCWELPESVPSTNRLILSMPPSPLTTAAPTMATARDAPATARGRTRLRQKFASCWASPRSTIGRPQQLTGLNIYYVRLAPPCGFLAARLTVSNRLIKLYTRGPTGLAFDARMLQTHTVSEAASDNSERMEGSLCRTR